MSFWAPSPDGPPPLEHPPPDFVESERGGLAVPSLDGRSSLVVHEGALYLERLSGERVLLLDSPTVTVGDEPVPLADHGEPELVERRALFARSETITEWYEPAAHGIEQGWTLAERPAGEGPLTIRLEVGTDVEAEQESPAYVTLLTGDDAIEYRELVAYDANGIELPSSMTLNDGIVVLEVDDRDAVYPITIDPWAVWTIYFLSPSVGTRGALYGRAVAVDEDVAVVGEPDEASATGIATGAVHVFRRSTTGAWSPERTIRIGVPPADTTAAEFGYAVSVWGNTLLVGSPAESSSRGAAYLIDLLGTFDTSGRPTGSTAVRLVPSTRHTSQRFGHSVGISGNRVVVGTGGWVEPRAYTWAWGGSSWYFESMLPSGAAGTGLFGSRVSIDPTNQNLVAIGAPSGVSGGNVYIYHRPVCCWPPTPAIVPAPSGRNLFGADLSVSNGRVGIAARGSSDTRAELWVATGWGTSWSASLEIESTGTTTTDSAYSTAFDFQDRQPWVAISGTDEILGFPNAAPPGGPSTSVEGTVDAPEVTGLSQTNYAGTTSYRARGMAVAMEGSTALLGRMEGTQGAIRAYNLRLANGSSCSTGSQCASGNCVDGVCCNTTCGGGSATDCMACSTANGGTTNGTCTALTTSFAPTVQCRASAGPCDVADSCVAGNTSCPNNFAPSTTVCNPATQPCELSATCSGSSATCPSKPVAPANTACGGAPSGACDIQDRCDGVNRFCPALFASNTTMCRAAGGPCELAAYCTGSSTSCPANAAGNPGTVCRSPAGPCEVAAVCSGTSTTCPANPPGNAGTVCGTPAGPCEVAAVCSGTSTTCPANPPGNAGAVCRSPGGPCEVAAQCTGTSTTCPANPPGNAGAVCNAATQPCQLDAVCTGTSTVCPPHAAASAGTVCNSNLAGPCDAPDVCNGTSFTCPSVFASAGTVCLPANGACDADDVCTGSSAACPPSFLPSSTVCRPVSHVCDVAESCSGSSPTCPADASIPMCAPEACGNGIDDDLDVLRDCFDTADCAGHPTCGTTELSCHDGIDNDADGTLDCADPECATRVCGDGSGDQLCIGLACVDRGCGDGYREPGAPGWPREACDDGNTSNDDACSSSCTPRTQALASLPSTESYPTMRAPSVAADGTGELLVVYTHDAGSTRALHAVRLSPSGAVRPGGPLVLRADVGLGWNAQPTVAGLPAGGWVVVWTDPFVDGDGAGIAMRRVSASGALGSVEAVNTDARGAQREGRVLALESGWVVAWTDESGLSTSLGESVIQTRQYGSDGRPLASEQRRSERGRLASQPALARSGARWILAWSDASPEAVGTPAVLARRFGGAGDDASAFLAVEQGAEPALATLSTGAFALAWVQRTTDPLGDIATRVLQPTGDALAGSTVTVLTGRNLSTTPPSAYAQTAPSIGVRTGGSYIVAYEDDGRRRGVRFAHVGTALPPEAVSLTDELLDGMQGDVSLLGTSRGVWFVWSDARPSTADRSVLSFLLPLD